MNTSTIVSPSSKPATKPVPAGFHTVTPHLVCAGAAEAIAFYQKAFGAVEQLRLLTPDGKILHASIKIGDSIIMLTDEFPQMGGFGPKARGGSSVTIHLYVDDADAWFARAVKAGAAIGMPIADMFWGDRYGQIVDPFGHSWSIATKKREMTHAEIQEAAQAACGGCG